MAKTGGDIEFENIPNDETVKATKKAEDGEVMEASNIDELFDSI